MIPMPSMAIVIGILVLGNVIFGKLYLHETREVARVETEYASFKAETKALGDKAAKEAATKEAQDKAAKEKADAEHQATVARLTADIKRLRADADRTRGSFVPAAPAASVRPDLACFDRTALESAVRDFVGEIRGQVDQGTAATVDLDNAKAWARAP